MAIIEDTDQDAFQAILTWIELERQYQIQKFNYPEDDMEHIKQGGDAQSWLWQQITNYVSRIRLFGLDTPQGRQAYMKLLTTLIGLGEGMIRVYGLPPAPQVSSGNIEQWSLNG